MKTWRTRLGALAAVLALSGASAFAGTLLDTNLVDLIRESDAIVIGRVASVEDGIDERGLPYTEVVLEIDETLQGGVQGTYTFRQFGLMAPRLSADGTKKMMPAPDIFPKYQTGEEVVLFLNRPASITGLQTTIGLVHGKFRVGATRVENGLGNSGIFRNVSVEDGLAGENDVRMLATEQGAVNSDSFLSFVRRAVGEDWISRGLMWRTDEVRGGGGGVPKPTKPGLPTPGAPDTIQSGSNPGSLGSVTFGKK